MSSDSDLSVAAAVPEQFMRLFGQSRDSIYRCILSLLPQVADADEVLQETTLVLWRKFGEFRPDGDFTRWACGIAYNQTRKFRREKIRDHARFSETLMERIAVVREENLELLETRSRVLDDCLKKLSARDRELMENYQSPGVTIKDIANQVGRPASTVYKAFKRIRLALFECVDRTLRSEGRQ